LTVVLKMKMATENKNQLKTEKIESKLLLVFTQPATAKQISKKTGIPVNTCSYIIGKFAKDGILTCLNPNASGSRLYWLTESGILQKKKLSQKLNIKYAEPNLPNIDWQLYGWVCFSHRSMVIKVLTSAMQPAKVKRILMLQRINARISASNIRDVMQLLLSKKIVKPVKVKKQAYLRYELTELGNKLRQLLLRAETAL